MDYLAKVPGFKFGGMHCGIKEDGLDLALIISESPCPAAAVFTQSQVIAEPLKVCGEILGKTGLVQAVVINSGNANACTGTKGNEAVWKEIHETSAKFDLNPDHVFISSTGVIGREFPIGNVVKGISEIGRHLGNKPENSLATATAIMTTDTQPKGSFQHYERHGNQISMAGIAKGSGMIHPNMGTMLGYVISNENIATDMLKKALLYAVDKSFNMISVDGDTSTNDTVLVMSNGKTGAPLITSEEDAGYLQFRDALTTLCIELAKAIVDDGEGATKVIEYHVKGLGSEKECQQVIKTLATSLLVKTAFFGKDPNWGRLLGAAGRSGVQFNPELVDLSFVIENTNLPLLTNGEPVELDEANARSLLEARNIRVVFDFNQGSASAIGWGTDLSYEYVKINAEYTT